MNEAVTKIKQRGHVYLWKYPNNQRNYPGWNLTADQEGCSFLSTLLATMAQSEFQAQYLIELARPSEKVVDVPIQGVKWATRSRLLLKYKPSHAWQLIDTPPSITLSFGKAGIDEFLKAVEDISKGKGDYEIGLEGEKHSWITIWWMV